MSHWKETAEILARLAELAAAGKRAALATVVDIVGSAYRRPGAKLLIEETGATLGSVSGGCLEADVREVAQALFASGGSARPSLRHYNTGDEDVVWGLGLGCNGLVDVFVQPATEGPLAALSGAGAGSGAGGLRKLLAGDAAGAGSASGAGSGGLRELFAGDAAVALATVIAGGAEDEPGATLAIDFGLPRSPAPAPAPRAAGEAPAAGEPREEEMAPLAGVHATLGTLGSPELDAQVVARARALLVAGRSGVQTIGGRQVFIEVLPPPPHLLVCGAGDDARPLVAYAADVGFRVTLLDHRPALLAPEWFPQAARRVVARPEDADLALPPPARSLAVVKTHSLAHDREWVRRLLAAGLPYVGVLGPRGRTESILRSVAASAAGRAGAGGGDERERVFGPVGLDLGADGPRQVAISIVAELLAFTAGREPRHLSARREAIHAG